MENNRNGGHIGPKNGFNVTKVTFVIHDESTESSDSEVDLEEMTARVREFVGSDRVNHIMDFQLPGFQGERNEDSEAESEPAEPGEHNFFDTLDDSEDLIEGQEGYINQQINDAADREQDDQGGPATKRQRRE